MIDWEDFPVRTPEQRLARAKRLLGLPSMAAFEAEGRKLEQRIEYLFNKYIVARQNLDLKSMSLDALLGRFEEICLVLDEVRHDPFEEGVEQGNICLEALWKVNDEIKSRGPDARRALLRFYNHPNYRVRLKAATHTYRVAQEPARRCLEELKKWQIPDVSLEAGMTLYAIDDGTSMLD